MSTVDHMALLFPRLFHQVQQCAGSGLIELCEATRGDTEGYPHVPEPEPRPTDVIPGAADVLSLQERQQLDLSSSDVTDPGMWSLLTCLATLLIL